MQSLQKFCLISLLTASALLVAIYGAVTPAGKSPDERHHFAYAYGIYEQGLTPFFDRKAILTDGKDLNHLRHPPGYYLVLAAAMAALNIDKDYDGAGLSKVQLSNALKKAAFQPLRAVSIGFYALHLLGLYLLVTYLVERRLLSSWAGIAATALVVFIPSRMHIAGTVNNDTMAIAVWPFLALYGTKTILEPSLSTLLKFAIAATIAALTKLTLAIVALPFTAAILVFQIFRVQPFGFEPKLRFWWEQIRSVRLRDAGLFTLFILLFAYGAAYYGNTLVKYGSVNPTYTQIYGVPDADNKFRVEGRKERSWVSIADDVVTGSWRTTTGTFGHDHLYANANIATELSLVAAALFSAFVALFLSAGFRLTTDPRNAAISATYLAVPAIFWLVWINWNVGNWAFNGKLGNQGRYTIGALELGIFGIFLAWSLIHQSSRREFNRVGLVGLALVFALLAPVFFKPLFYANQNEHLYFAGSIPKLTTQNLRSEGFRRINLSGLEPKRLAKSGFVATSRRSLHTNYFVMAPDKAMVAGPAQRIDQQKFKAVEIAVWARAGSRPTDFRLSVRDTAKRTNPVVQTISLNKNITVTTRCFPVTDEQVTLSIRRIDPDYSLLTRLFKNDNPPILLGAYAKPVAECK